MAVTPPLFTPPHVPTPFTGASCVSSGQFPGGNWVALAFQPVTLEFTRLLEVVLWSLASMFPAETTSSLGIEGLPQVRLCLWRWGPSSLTHHWVLRAQKNPHRWCPRQVCEVVLSIPAQLSFQKKKIFFIFIFIYTFIWYLYVYIYLYIYIIFIYLYIFIHLYNIYICIYL